MYKFLEKKLEKKMKVILYLFTALFFSITLFAQEEQSPKHEKLEYEVNVNAIIVPVFAVDADGEPVYDLKKEEIEFFVDGKPFNIAQFMRFQVEENKGKKKTTDRGRKVDISTVKINFIIIDVLSNSRVGVKRSKKIALGIIKKSPLTDAFIILESAPRTGFRYIIGPEMNRKKLAAAVKKIGGLTRRRHWSIYDTFKEDGGNSSDLDGYSFEQRAAMFKMAVNKVNREKDDYYDEIKNFLNALTQLKYALKTITLPKHVFLISGGIPSKTLGTNLPRYYKFIMNAAKAINYGGSILYLINSVPSYERNSKGESLKYMADESGGKYFGGSNVDKIINRVKNHTAAYYELAFSPDRQLKDKMKIKIKCKRKGVTISSANYSERGKPYKEMAPLQKKLFALNVVTGGSWSRIVGNVKKVKLKNSKKRHTKNISKQILVNLPEDMINRSLDIFVINLDPKTMKANFKIIHKTEVKKSINIEIPTEKDKSQYVVIIEPTLTYCLYNQVT